jgi:hypothetical protein
VDRWERFWFAPEPAATLALLRIAVAVVTLAWTLAYAPDLATFTGPNGIAPGGASAYRVVYLGLIAAAVCLLAGYRSRPAAAAVFVCLAWLHRVDPWALNSGDALLRDITFLLALAPAGACLSVDAALRSPGGARRIPHLAPWGLRLVQVQVSIMYLAAVASKLAGSAWRDGTAVSFPLRIPAMVRLRLPEQLTASPLIAHVLTWGVVGTELAIGVLVWSRRARPWVLGAGVLLHLGIEMALRVGFFSWVVLAAYVAFLPPERAARIVAALGRPGRRGPRLLIGTSAVRPRTEQLGARDGSGPARSSPAGSGLATCRSAMRKAAR